MNSLTVSMIGLGYIGLPTAALIASNKINVYGIDVNQNIVDTINKGKIHIVEPGLEKLVHNAVNSGFLSAHSKTIHTDVYLIAVPTPFKEGMQPDLKYVESATRMIIPVLEENDLIIIESTSPVGTTELMLNLIYSLRPELINKIYMAYCPERVLPGNVIYELKHNDRVIGGINEQSTNKAIAFYKKFVTGELHPTNAKTAELCKLVENSSRDAQIAFANELSMICDKANINVWELIELANKHPRVNILQPGTGVGGHCIAVDPWFIVSEFPEQAKLIKAAREINNYKTEWVIEKCKNIILQFELNYKKKPKVACMGLAFKPNIDDLRESPASSVVNNLYDQNKDLIIVEPNIKSHNKFTLSSIENAISQADIIIFLVGHNDFKNIKLNNQIILDFCNYNK